MCTSETYSHRKAMQKRSRHKIDVLMFYILQWQTHKRVWHPKHLHVHSPVAGREHALLGSHHHHYFPELLDLSWINLYPLNTYSLLPPLHKPGQLSCDCLFLWIFPPHCFIELQTLCVFQGGHFSLSLIPSRFSHATLLEFPPFPEDG